jgi:hypothetical protein
MMTHIQTHAVLGVSEEAGERRDALEAADAATDFEDPCCIYLVVLGQMY